MTTIEFNTMVTRQAESLKQYALRFTHDSEDANDLVQDTILKALSYCNKFKEGTNLKGWLYTIMKNTFINKYRRFVKIGSMVIQSDEIPYANLMYSASNNLGESKFIMEDIRTALEKLSDEYYVPFSMYFDGHKYHEIAEHLTIPIGTVKTRIHVARKLLKKSLNDYNPEVNKPFYLN
jgi:RNA polymerase sigma-70 factor (ECF subfamily)